LQPLPEFVRTAQTFESVAAYELFLEDLDADGDTDAVISSFGNSLILMNDGSGVFSETWRRRTVHGMVLGDIDLDGDRDLVVSPYWHEGGLCDIYLNDGRGEFEQVESKLCQGDGPSFMLVRLVDLDGDGDLDAVDYRADGMPVAWLNDGRGRFERSGVPIPRCADFADLDGDGFTDVLSREGALELRCDSLPGCGDLAWVPREGDTGVRIYLNDREGHFESHQFLPLSRLATSGHNLSWLIDIDNDGDRDVIYTEYAGHPNPVGVLLNDGTGRLTEGGEGLATVNNGQIGAGDLNNDGYVDLVIASHENPAQVWMNDGTGAFHDSGLRLGERFASQSLGVADLDQDGDLDIFITDYRRPGTSVWMNQLNPDARSPQQGSPRR